jgi:hypothetical protein
MGAPKGNQNAHKGKVWKDAIHRYVVQHPKVLGDLAASLVMKAREGDVAALKELGDRLDGKVAQSIIGEDGGDLRLIHRIERVIIDPDEHPKD